MLGDFDVLATPTKLHVVHIEEDFRIWQDLAHLLLDHTHLILPSTPDVREKEVEPARRQIEHPSFCAIHEMQLPGPVLAARHVKLVQQDEHPKQEDPQVEDEDDGSRILRICKAGLCFEEAGGASTGLRQRAMHTKEPRQDQRARKGHVGRKRKEGSVLVPAKGHERPHTVWREQGCGRARALRVPGVVLAAIYGGRGPTRQVREWLVALHLYGFA